MINIAIVEDDKAETERLDLNLSEYSQKHNVQFHIAHFDKSENLLNYYQAEYDIVFMDIELGSGMNGMNAAQRLREMDSNVIIIFVTNMRRYACDGYAVNALDFIVKPILPVRFESVMNRARQRLAQSNVTDEMLIHTSGGVVRVRKSDVLFVEVQRHRVMFHTTEGEYACWNTMKKIKEDFPPKTFALCNSGYLVNLKYVKTIKDDSVFIGEYELKISRSKKKSFTQALIAYLGGGV